MVRQCFNCHEVLYLSSLKDENGVNYLKCPNCGTLQLFRKEKEEHLDKLYHTKFKRLKVCK